MGASDATTDCGNGIGVFGNVVGTTGLGGGGFGTFTVP